MITGILSEEISPEEHKKILINCINSIQRSLEEFTNLLVSSQNIYCFDLGLLLIKYIVYTRHTINHRSGFDMHAFKWDYTVAEIEELRDNIIEFLGEINTDKYPEMLKWHAQMTFSNLEKLLKMLREYKELVISTS